MEGKTWFCTENTTFSFYKWLRECWIINCSNNLLFYYKYYICVLRVIFFCKGWGQKNFSITYKISYRPKAFLGRFAKFWNELRPCTHLWPSVVNMTINKQLEMLYWRWICQEDSLFPSVVTFPSVQTFHIAGSKFVYKSGTVSVYTKVASRFVRPSPLPTSEQQRR